MLCCRKHFCCWHRAAMALSGAAMMALRGMIGLGVRMHWQWKQFISPLFSNNNQLFDKHVGANA